MSFGAIPGAGIIAPRWVQSRFFDFTRDVTCLM